MTLTPDRLYASPNALAPHYASFRVHERLLLTGHSHQAWPDIGLDGQHQAWLDAAEHVDDKWDLAAQKAEEVRAGYRRLMGGCDGDLTLDTNTHALVVRFLSALPLSERPRLVTTDGEFHSIRRQLDRLAEVGVEVVQVADDPLHSLSERVAAEVDDRTAAVLISSVLFGTGRTVSELPSVAEACIRCGAELLIDAYHSLNVVPFSLRGLENAFVVAGGYKYCQLGEGNCVLRVPPHCELRPVITGWFSEFSKLTEAKVPGGGPVWRRGSPLRRVHLRSDVALSGGGSLWIVRAGESNSRAVARGESASSRRPPGDVPVLGLGPDCGVRGRLGSVARTGRISGSAGTGR